jgi:hypothetical protein
MFVYRPPNDTFTMRIFLKCAAQIKKPHDRLYIWSPILDPNYKKLKQINHFFDRDEHWYDTDEHGALRHNVTTHYKTVVTPYEDESMYRKQILNEIQNDIIVIGVKDHLTSSHFNPWMDKMPEMARSIDGLFESFDDKKFVFFTSLENTETYYDYPNVYIIPWGGDITNQAAEYKKLDPIVEKDMTSPYTFVSLNRGLRHPRAMLISILYGLDLEKKGMISCMFQKKLKNIFKETGWQFREDQQDIQNTIEIGFKKFKKSKLLINDDENIYGNSPNDNVTNFKDSLSSYYKKTFVELIGETSYTEPAFNLTEKTLNSIYASNFPIWISSKGTVKFVREMGIDVFDDIIDHSYDLIENPIDRMFKAINDNKCLLTDIDKTKQLWLDSKDRFLKNIEFAKKDLYDFYNQRADCKFKEALNDLENKGMIP